MMSGPNEDSTPPAGSPDHDDQPGLVDSVPLFPAVTPPPPPLPSASAPASDAPQPPYRRTRAAAREQRLADLADEVPVDTVPARPATPRPPASSPAAPAPVASGPIPSAPAPVPSAPVPSAPVTSTPVPPTPVRPAPTPSAPLPSAPVARPHAPASPTPASAPASVEPASRREQRELRERHSFLRTERAEEPAREGARGALNRLGLRIRPSAEEQSARDDELAVSQHWPGPRTIAVVNGKGGAGKTPTTILLAAVFARYGGAGVLAWDNNQTRGTLGWRTDTGAHDRTLLELLPEAGRLLGTGAQSADLAHFMHHQPREKYDVLRSKPIRLAHENRLRPADVDAIHAVAAKFYRLIIIDSGNDESDPMWLRMIDHADQLVVATTTRADHAEAGALLLEALEDRDERSARLAQQSVVVVSQADPKATSADVEHVVSGYRTLARDVLRIPFDHEMVDGHLRYGALAKHTQRAWLAAAASVARGF
ncbi:AAA family ATPase [Microbacterium sp. 179-I 3D3 NHS]|uniref:MinD/ParA family ATP-binding protein n=1 Tax=Microbacterium sp. 179-I 3D3 NHS TaxID=3142382 RepID=UPI0039A2F63B